MGSSKSIQTCPKNKSSEKFIYESYIISCGSCNFRTKKTKKHKTWDEAFDEITKNFRIDKDLFDHISIQLVSLGYYDNQLEDGSYESIGITAIDLTMLKYSAHLYVDKKGLVTVYETCIGDRTSIIQYISNILDTVLDVPYYIKKETTKELERKLSNSTIISLATSHKIDDDTYILVDLRERSK